MSLGAVMLRAPGRAMAPARADQDLAAIAAPVASGTREFRGLRHSIERLHREAGAKVILISSAASGDGKSVTTLNLAAALAESPGTRVLVVDADLHKASISSYLGLARDAGPGLADLLDRPSLALPEVARRVNGIDLSIVFAGAPHPRPFRLFSSPRMDGLFAEMRERYDYVLFDTPPIVSVADCRVLSRWSDGVLLVVRAHQTPRKMVTEALRLLGDGVVLGVVFNDDDRLISQYYTYYGLDTNTAAGARQR